MGEAKRRAKERQQKLAMTHPISRARFGIYAIGTRMAQMFGMSHEVSWWATSDERILGTIAFDYQDEEFTGIILARDEMGRFRCTEPLIPQKNQLRAEIGLRNRIAEIIKTNNIDAYGQQGDTTNSPLDLFDVPETLDKDKLHPYFVQLLNSPGKKPARVVLSEIARWLAPADPHLVREFQTSGFDQRLWEIYLWAAFKDSFVNVEQLEAPDFACRGHLSDFTVEATTVSASTSGPLKVHPEPKTPEEIGEFIKDYMAIKFGSALTSKLDKTNAQGLHYWERERTKGKPFLIAVADFHEPPEKFDIGSMVYTQTALWNYLYGIRVNWNQLNETAELEVTEEKIETHTYGSKTIPSGFFNLPGSENISAVLFSNAGTIAKFDRIGVTGGFGADKHTYKRMGFKYDPDPNATIGRWFETDVSDDNYEEFWSQELQVFHNPKAKIPLPPESLLTASHHFFEDGALRSSLPDDAVLNSTTWVVRHVDMDEEFSAIDRDKEPLDRKLV